MQLGGEYRLSFITRLESHNHPTLALKELSCAENRGVPPRNLTTFSDVGGNPKIDTCNCNVTIHELRQRDIELEGRLGFIGTVATNMHPSREGEMIRVNASQVNVH
jgi:hypothetical protein